MQPWCKSLDGLRGSTKSQRDDTRRGSPGSIPGGCKAKLLVEQDDIFCTYSHHYDGSSYVYHTFKCPECGVLTEIKESLPFTPRQPRKSDSGATYTGSAGSGVPEEDP